MSNEDILTLYDLLKSMGFSANLILGDELRNLISQGLPDFELETETDFDDFITLEVRLCFCKSGKKDSYSLQKYQATLRHRDNPKKDRSHTFYAVAGANLRLKEVCNLLQGRAVNKDLTPEKGESYNAWLQLNFKEKDHEGNFKLMKFRSYYGYELANVLNKYPIRELADNNLKEAIVQSLKAGDRRLVTFLKPSGKTEKKMIEANPTFKTINIYSVVKATQKDRE